MTTALQILVVVTLIGIIARLAVTRLWARLFWHARQRLHSGPGWHRGVNSANRERFGIYLRAPQRRRAPLSFR
jgi:hypothetical protein